MVNTVLLTTSLFAQTEKFDIASFVPPKDWQRQEANGTVSFLHSTTVNGLTSFCQITLFPSTASTGNVASDFKAAWDNVVAIPAKSAAQPKTETAKTNDGWQIMTGAADITQSGVTYTAMLITATGFGRSLSVQVKAAGGDYMPVISKFFDDLNLDSKAAAANIQQGNNMAGSSTALNRSITVNDYDFIAPPQWQVQNNKDHLKIQSMESGCLILIFAPQASSGDLEKDAKTVFETMYPGWNFQKTGRQHHTLSKGYTPQGLEFFMMEATMGKLSADGSRYDGFEEGAALVIKAGAQIMIVAVRHNSSLMAHDNCYRKYEYWRRFFNTFTVKNAAVAKSEEDPSKRIVGRWSMAESGGTGEYLFAANGNYALVGAIGSSYTTKDETYEYFHTKTSAFQGDGSYSIAGNQLTLKKRGTAPEQIRFRIEKVNHGGTGWKDRIFMLKKAGSGENEASYEKQDK